MPTRCNRGCRCRTNPPGKPAPMARPASSPAPWCFGCSRWPTPRVAGKFCLVAWRAWAPEKALPPCNAAAAAPMCGCKPPDRRHRRRNRNRNRSHSHSPQQRLHAQQLLRHPQPKPVQRLPRTVPPSPHWPARTWRRPTANAWSPAAPQKTCSGWAVTPSAPKTPCVWCA